MRPTRRRRTGLWFRYLPAQLRVMLFGPRPLALIDRLWGVATSMIVLFLIGLVIHQTHTLHDNGISRACTSYAADQVAFDKTLEVLDRFGISDPDFRNSILQSRDQKQVLRTELHCPPYPPPPDVAPVPGDHAPRR